MGHETEWFEERDRKTERPTTFPLILWATLLAIVLGAAFHAGKVFAAPKAESAEECALVADMALVARALAESKEPLVPAARAEVVMQRIYVGAEEPHPLALMHAVIATAYAIDAAPLDYSKQLLRACLRGRGDMDSILGSEI